MKIAITSTGNFPGAQLDLRFGRCSYLVIFDTVSQSTEYIPNCFKDNIEGVGQASMRFLAAKDVEKVVSGEFGIKVKSISDSLKIQLIIMPDQSKTIQDIINYFIKPKQ
jgi:predicted Fe-Mo cluster-binding NifX family protein